MPSFIYNPDCPLANSNGMVEKSSDYYYWLSMQKESKQMFIGNQPVEFRFISDSMNTIRHMCDGKYYDSKSKFRKITKQHGCVEVGNETEFMLKKGRRIETTSQRYAKKKQRREDIKRAVWELQNGRDIRTEVKNVIEQDKKSSSQ